MKEPKISDPASIAKVANSPSIYPSELRTSRTNSTILFSEISTTWRRRGFRLKISRVTAWPMEPAPPMTRKREEATREEISASRAATSFAKSSRSRPIRSRMKSN